jgi:hypothetical protein
VVLSDVLLAAVWQTLDEDPGCPPGEWPYLRGVPVAAWQLYVHSHRRANDEHIRLMDLSRAGEVLSLDQGETKLVAAVPTVNNHENFVVGLAVDYSNQVRRICSCSWRLLPWLLCKLCCSRTALMDVAERPGTASTWQF